MPDTRPVLLAEGTPARRHQFEPFAGQAAGLVGDREKCLSLPVDHPLLFPLPGRGATRTLWESLATLGSIDLSLARMLEPHLDATAILAEARRALPTTSDAAVVPDVGEGTWGVFAAEGAGTRLVAGRQGDQVVLSGRKPWCSLAGSLSHALVTAWVDETRRGLYAVALTHPGVEVDDEVDWVARGLRDVPSVPVSFNGVPAVPVGGPGWYLERPGFAWGGIGVAAIWFGATVAIARRVFAQARQRQLDQVGQSHLGAIDAALICARSVLCDTAALADSEVVDPAEVAIAALRCRRVAAQTAETVLWRSDHALGPAPLALEEDHAARVADLRLYVRQEHAERDEAALGRALVSRPHDVSPW
ncbi:MAG: acyl-CoA dehydrogenase family protein [Terracoccus sp.]